MRSFTNGEAGSSGPLWYCGYNSPMLYKTFISPVTETDDYISTRPKGYSKVILFLSTTYNSSISIIDAITVRELDILRHLATGKSSKQIGDELSVSRHTVDTHRRNLLKKLNCRSIVELTHLAYKNGVL